MDAAPDTAARKNVLNANFVDSARMCCEEIENQVFCGKGGAICEKGRSTQIRVLYSVSDPLVRRFRSLSDAKGD